MPAYDRELIARMLDEYAKHTACDMDLAHLESSIAEKAALLRAADNAEAVADTVSLPAEGGGVDALSEYDRGFRDGYERRHLEVLGALV